MTQSADMPCVPCGFMVAGTGTNVGTVFTAALLRTLWRGEVKTYVVSG